MGWKSKLAKFRNINSRRLGGDTWRREKEKAAGMLKIMEKLGGKHIVHQTMKRNWYRHIDKAVEGKANSRDEKHWKKMAKTFEKEVVGDPSPTTLDFLRWLKGMPIKVKNELLTDEDYIKWLPEFREYMEDCEQSAINLYIAKNKLVEGFD